MKFIKWLIKSLFILGAIFAAVYAATSANQKVNQGDYSWLAIIFGFLIGCFLLMLMVGNSRKKVSGQQQQRNPAQQQPAQQAGNQPATPAVPSNPAQATPIVPGPASNQTVGPNTKKSFWAAMSGAWWALVALFILLVVNLLLLKVMKMAFSWSDYRLWVPGAVGTFTWFLMYPIRDYWEWPKPASWLNNTGWILLLTQGAYNILDEGVFHGKLIGVVVKAIMLKADSFRSYLDMWMQTQSFILFIVILIFVTLLVLGLVEKGLKGAVEHSVLLLQFATVLALLACVGYGAVWVVKYLDAHSRDPITYVHTEKCKRIPFTFTEKWTKVPGIPSDNIKYTRRYVDTGIAAVQWYKDDDQIVDQTPVENVHFETFQQGLCVRSKFPGTFQGEAQYFYEE